MARFIIATENFRKAEADALTAVLDDSSYAYWHWVESFWLVLTPDNTQTARQLWNEVVEAVPSIEPKTMLVMRIDKPMSYFGRANDAAWNWLAANKIGTPS